VFGLIALLVAQVGTGLFADDEIASTGPLVRFVSEATSHALSRWHRGSGQWLIVALVALHVGAILYYRLLKKRDLVRPMLTGDKRLAVAAPPSVDNARSRTLALALLLACAGVAAWVASLGS